MAHGMCQLFQGPDGSDSQHSLPCTLQAAVPQVVGSTIESVANQTQAGLWASVFETDEGKVLRNKIQAERKIQLEGGNGVGPAQVPKSAKERRRNLQKKLHCVAMTS